MRHDLLVIFQIKLLGGEYDNAFIWYTSTIDGLKVTTGKQGRPNL